VHREKNFIVVEGAKPQLVNNKLKNHLRINPYSNSQ
jgi:hypothetical protein